MLVKDVLPRTWDMLKPSERHLLIRIDLGLEELKNVDPEFWQQYEENHRPYNAVLHALQLLHAHETESLVSRKIAELQVEGRISDIISLNEKATLLVNLPQDEIVAVVRSHVGRVRA